MSTLVVCNVSILPFETMCAMRNLQGQDEFELKTLSVATRVFSIRVVSFFAILLCVFGCFF